MSNFTILTPFAIVVISPTNGDQSEPFRQKLVRALVLTTSRYKKFPMLDGPPVRCSLLFP